MLTNLCRVIRRSKDQLWGPVVPRTDVRHVWLVLNKYLCAAKITQLQYASARVQQQVLWLDVAVADPLGVDIGQGTEQLVDVKLDLEDGHCRLHLIEVPRGAVHGFGNKFLDQVQVDLILLRARLAKQGKNVPKMSVGVYPLAVRVVESLQLYDIWVSNNPHNLQLAILHKESAHMHLR